MAINNVCDINLKELIERETGQRFNRQGKIICPFHSEKTPSLSIRFNPDMNKEQYKCFGCGANGDAIDFVKGLKNLDYTKAREYLGLSVEKSSNEQLEDKLKAFIEWQINKTDYRKGHELTGIFPFVDSDNNTLYFKAKFLKTDGSKDMAYYHIDNGKVLCSRGGDEVPYNLYRTLQAIKDDKVIVICEGEKDANTINSLFKGKVYEATSVKGVKNLSVLEGAKIYVCGDTGQAGEEYKKAIYNSLFNSANVFKYIDLTGIEELGDNKDVTDWIEAGRNKEELRSIFIKSLDIKLKFNIKKYDFTNKGLLDRFVDINKEKIKYVNDMGQYIYWDGKKWSLEDDKRLGKEAANFLYKLIDDVSLYIKYMKDAKDADEEKVFIGINKSLKKLTPIKTIKENYLNSDVWISTNNLDENINLLNCQNGALNLNTGELLPHDPKLYFTKVTNIEYNPSAKCPNFLNSLDWILPNKETRQELQKAFGYSLGGGMEHQVTFILWGKGENGKSTIMDPLKDMLGDYYASLNAKSLEPKKDGSAASSDMAKLTGTRCVITSEPSQGQRIDDGQLKTFAVGEEVNARFLRQNEFTFKPEFKLWIPTNTLPIITNTEHGFWRRIVIFPCKNKPKEKILNFYKDFIKPNELPGILNWALEGRQILKKEGFNPTMEMVEALQEYKAEVNPMEEFVLQCCEKDEDLKILTGALLNTYNVWALSEGYSELKVRTFRNRLIDMGYTVRKSNQNKSYVLSLNLKKDLSLRSSNEYEEHKSKIERQFLRNKMDIIQGGLPFD